METTSGAGHPLPYDSYRQAIEQETLRLVELVKGADPASPVPACPGWTLAVLTQHVGGVQRWFSALLTRRVRQVPTSRDIDLGLPERAEEYADWLAAGVPDVADVLRSTDPEAAMWAWGEDQHARFWARRMLFETLVHRMDAEHAVGRPAEVEALLAADGVDEFLVNLPHAGIFAPRVKELRGGGETVSFRCLDAGAGAGEEWRVRLDADGFRLLPRADVPGTEATAAVRATAADLLLLLYGRRSHEESAFDVSGDTALLERWFAHTAF
ncbi:maleylpyruvate isomerase family mycothiol-dependent enzyme [Streptomyces sp. NPDC048664]|uniref:maleylpyruvate isomerase family mycothiol-dependent enzyme n=1 Tax=Streptomyces sp. NPDC048664 TaxID=3154505 RepID=UPI003442B3BB